jgi:hypothetical protein
MLSPEPPLKKPGLAYNPDTCILQYVYSAAKYGVPTSLPITHAIELSSDAPRDCIGLLELAVVRHVSGCMGLGAAGEHGGLKM